MRKLASLLLVLTVLTTACAGNSGTDTESTGNGSASVPTGSPSQTVTDTSDERNPSTYPAPSEGSVSLLSFHRKSNPLTAEQIADCVEQYLPDVFTVSDAPKSLSDGLTAKIEGYALIGQPASESGNYQAIFYRESRIEAVKSATIWLTDTPAEQSKWNGAEDYDICTYALLTDRDTEKQFAIFQASLSENPQARAEEIICLYAKYACYKDYFPTLLTGNLTGGDNSVLTAGGGLTRQSDDLYSVCMECDVTEVSKDGSAYATYGSLIPGETPYKIDLTKKFVALTFDDGPRIDSAEHAYTEAVLESLANAGCKATFFVVGNRLKSSGQADLLRQEFAAGHEIGNHTYDHTSYTQLSGDELMTNLAKTDDLVRELTGGIPTLLLRAPGGSNRTDAPLTRPLVNWSVDTKDWSSQSTPESVFETVKTKVSAGSIVLMHDLHKNSPDTLDDMLAWLDENSYQPVTVSELFEFSDIQMDSDHAYYSTRNIKSR